MRNLTIPAVLVVVPLAFGCSSPAPLDAGRDALADLSDALDGFEDRSDLDASTDAPVDADIADIADRQDAPDSDAPQVCEGRRNGDGGVECHEENVQGSGLFCIQLRCAADDGGVTFDDCCRLIG